MDNLSDEIKKLEIEIAHLYPKVNRLTYLKKCTQPQIEDLFSYYSGILKTEHILHLLNIDIDINLLLSRYLLMPTYVISQKIKNTEIRINHVRESLLKDLEDDDE